MIPLIVNFSGNVKCEILCFVPLCKVNNERLISDMSEQMEMEQVPGDVPSKAIQSFDPTFHDLEANFRLTKFADLKGRTFKVAKDVLSNLLECFQDEQSQLMHVPIPKIGIGMDSSITPLRHSGFVFGVDYGHVLSTSGGSLHAR